uniref:Capsid protein n=1 Tax=Genomoviridae sp. TaxID=2202565 RepID=A0A858NG49_9VIRU|nr:MAG: capsid protein [Genomoviridae sp.]
MAHHAVTLARLAAPSIGYAAQRYIAPAYSLQSAFARPLDTSRKRPRLQLIGGSNKRLKLTDFNSLSRSRTRRVLISRRRYMPRFRRRTRRRYGRKKRSFGRRRAKKNFNRRVAFASEPKSMEYCVLNDQTLAVGDGVSKTAIIWTPICNLRQGLQKDQFIGSSVFVRGISVRAAFSNNTDFQGMIVRMFMFRSRMRSSNMENVGATMTSATTPDTVPVQTADTGFLNPPVFSYATNPERYVGVNGADKFDTTNIKLLKVKRAFINPGGAGGMPNIVKWWFPINKRIVFDDPIEGDFSATAPHGKWGDYYLYMQVFSPLASDVLSTTTVRFDMKHEIYFRD